MSVRDWGRGPAPVPAWRWDDGMRLDGDTMTDSGTQSQSVNRCLQLQKMLESGYRDRQGDGDVFRPPLPSAPSGTGAGQGRSCTKLQAAPKLHPLQPDPCAVAWPD